MKASIAFSVLSLSSSILAAPILLKVKHTPPKYSGPQITSPDIWIARQPKFSLSGGDSAQDAWEERPNNRPYTPSSDITPAEALAAPRPLQTSYLLSLKPTILPAGVPEEKVADEKQVVQKPDFQQSSTVKEETGAVTKHFPSIVELETQANTPYQSKTPCHGYLVRQYVDMPVVSIVFLLISIIALIELWDTICVFSSKIWHGEGRIRLEDDVNEKAPLERCYADSTLRALPETSSRSDVDSEGLAKTV